jgi:hypothetical protein
MALYARLGRVAHVQRVYRELKARLSQDFDVESSDETTALRDSLIGVVNAPDTCPRVPFNYWDGSPVNRLDLVYPLYSHGIGPSLVSRNYENLRRSTANR